MNSLQERLLNKDGQPLVMGILNVTPDSFSDGGRFQTKDRLISRVLAMQEAGVDILDVGGESTRPGADVVSAQEEMDRVVPAIQWIREVSDLPISVDTYKTQVMDAVLKYDVQMINDVNALQSEGAITLLSQYPEVSVCLMHKQGLPKDMQLKPQYASVVDEVMAFLKERIEACQVNGVEKNNIFIDPGFGFGKSLAHNVELFGCLERFQALSYPMLVGVSRKSMIGELQGTQVGNRVIGSVIAAVMAAQKGAKILRVHDVQETVQGLSVARALQ